MNFLESLTARARETVAIVEPPRIPFVNLFPEGATGPGAEPTGPAVPLVRSRGDAPAPTVPAAADHHAAISTERTAQRAPEPTPATAPRRAPAPTAIGPRPPAIERVIERPVLAAEPADRPLAAPPTATGPRPPPPITTMEERWLREVRETQIERSERHTERVIEPAPPTPAPPPAVTVVTSAAAAIEPRRPLVVAPTVAPPSVPAALRPSPAETPPALPAAPGAAPVVVSIGRIVVQVQAPPVAARGERTRPAAPTLDLDAYNAARRRGDGR